MAQIIAASAAGKRSRLRWSRLLPGLGLILLAGYLAFVLRLYDPEDVLANPRPADWVADPEADAVVQHVRKEVSVVYTRDTTNLVAVSADGSLMVDTAEPPYLETLEAGLREVTGLPVRVIINTHPHGDHVGGNLHFGRDGARIIASRASADQLLADLKEDGADPDYIRATLPTTTFSGSYEFTFGNETVRLTEITNAHSHGDTVVQFVNANVIAAGDLLVNEGLPFVSEDRGMTIDGYLAGMETLIAMCDDDTIIVPGHGPVANKARLVEVHDRLRHMRNVVAFWKRHGLPPKVMFLFYPTYDWPLGWNKYGVTQKYFAKMVYRTADVSR
ncbi:MAG: MBL fold metallo-hydrolase [Defluviimonas sp.]|uniref:MBL fold metallo-hydrolase n=1 Tax=Albidovulum sp. TaxID=1872424 RepID=UPI002A2F9F20|nr:MBL fold metallo-hydrolase [Defluviimonas sp.]